MSGPEFGAAAEDDEAEYPRDVDVWPETGSAACRALTEEWMSYVAASEQDEFRARFRSGDNVLFGTAFQELFLHEFLRRHPAVVHL